MWRTGRAGWRPAELARGLAAIAMTACIPHHYDVPPSEIAGGMEASGWNFVLTLPRGNWVNGGTVAGTGAEGASSCDQLGAWATQGVRSGLERIGTLDDSLHFCVAHGWGLDIGEGASHLTWGLSAFSAELPHDSLAAADSTRAAPSVDSLLMAARLIPAKDSGKEHDTVIAKVAGVTYRWTCLKRTDQWLAVLVRPTMIYAVAFKNRPSPPSDEYGVLQSFRPWH
jgi:hypothetical protein